MARKKKEATSKSPSSWYADGLCFECQPDCGGCCTTHDDYAFVYLQGDDLDRLVDFLEIPEEEFIGRYTALDDGHVVLRMDELSCPFLDGARCTVYPARPTQCRTFPFWQEILVSRERWSELKEFCPGIDRGPKAGLDHIQEQLALRTIDD